MSANAALTAADAMLKSYYTKEAIQNMVYKNNPLFAMVPKDEKFTGSNKVVPVIYADPQGRSKTFSNAVTRGAATKTQTLSTKFVITRARDYSIATMDTETILASQGDANAFMAEAKIKNDGAINALKRSLGIGIYRKSYGHIGQVSAEPSENASTFDVILKDEYDATNFEVGMMIKIYSAETSGTARSSDGSDDEWVISAINRSTYTLTLTGTYDASGTIAADDYIFVEGDEDENISGVLDWIPASAPGSTAFFGVDRSVDVDRLGGIRYDGSAVSIEEAFVNGANKCARLGDGSPEYAFVNMQKFGELENALGTKVQYVNISMGSDSIIGFRGIIVNGPEGPIRVIPDRNALNSYAFMLEMSNWKLASLGPAVRVLNIDGNQMLRQASEDGVEVRYGFYGNLHCNAPGHNAIITLP